MPSSTHGRSAAKSTTTRFASARRDPTARRSISMFIAPPYGTAPAQFRYGVRVIQDVTEAKRMEDRILQSERHMRELLEALPAAVYTTDAEGRITFFNKAAVDMAGRTPRPGDEWCVTWRLYNPDGTPLAPRPVSDGRRAQGESAGSGRGSGRRAAGWHARPVHPLPDATA